MRTEIDRRSLLRGAVFIAAAPAIVRISSLMPVRAFSEAPIIYRGAATTAYNADDVIRAEFSEFSNMHIKKGDVFYIDHYWRGGKIATSSITYPQGRAQELLQREMALRNADDDNF